MAKVAKEARLRLEEGAGTMAREERGVRVGGSSRRAVRWLLMHYIRYEVVGRPPITKAILQFGVIYSVLQTELKCW